MTSLATHGFNVDGPLAVDRGFALLFEEFLARREYERRFALRLRDTAIDRSASWPVRRVATLMLEHQLLAGNDLKFWLRELKIRELDARSLRRRLARNSRVHERLTRSDASIADFLHLAGRDCRLTLARWLWTPQEIFARIDEAVQHSTGIRSRPDYGHRWVDVEAAAVIEGLRPLERDLVIRLGHKAVMRWVSPRTSSEINSLIEYPLGTVVMTIKPPGSDDEIEIKRTGVRGEFPLSVVYEKDGYVVPPSHHLNGGAMEHLLGVEASQSSVLSRLYRLVHGRTAPMSRTVHLASVFTMPTRNGEVDLLDYFTDPSVFGDRYEAMRGNMERVTADTAKQMKQARSAKVNALSLTVEFLGLMKPAQAIQVGTTSFRLERLDLYLADHGDARYFAQLGVPHTRHDSRRFADEILDEILCVYEPPPGPFRSYRTYLDAAFAVRANRERADRNYLDVMAQIGRFWGTLLAPRGHTMGESFVGRNCGLRSVFEDGEWRIRIIFMDHDSLIFASRYEKTYSPRPSVRAAAKDAKFILGESFGGKRPVRGELDSLRDIYRVTRATERRGLAALREAMKDAYDRTQHAMRHDREVRKMFIPEFVNRLGDWDDVVRLWLGGGRDWKSEVISTLLARGYEQRIAEHHVEALVTQKLFLEKMAFLF
ncbi:MAG TPA: hypothetical protein VNA69_11005 [Thermoanaerobaculia bacterium]|nr:hypothetical protein [Thermoanaerobaculia bacterium]